MGFSLALLEKKFKGAAIFIRKNITTDPTIGIVCGTGLEELPDQMRKCVSMIYTDIPGFPVLRTMGHPGNFFCGFLGENSVALMETRLRSYEGYSPQQCATPIQIMRTVGVKTLVLTTVAGNLNSAYSTGDYMLVSDHLYFPGLSGEGALVDTEESEFTVQNLFSKRNCYSEELRKKFKAVLEKNKLNDHFHEGTYAMIGGPACATEAELKFLTKIGADAHGMSLCHEVAAAIECGMEVIGIAIINDKYGNHLQKCIDDEAKETLRNASAQLAELVQQFIKSL